jgi:hypothetical protein
MKSRMHWLSTAIAVGVLTFGGGSKLIAACEFCERGWTNCGAVRSEPEPDQYTEATHEYCDGKPDWHELLVHRFPGSGGGGGTFIEDCSGPDPDPDDCRACGNQSNCHTEWDVGGCHEPCSPHFAAVAQAIEFALQTEDAPSLIGLLASNMVTFLNDDSSVIRVTSSCGQLVEFSVAAEMQALLYLEQYQPRLFIGRGGGLAESRFGMIMCVFPTRSASAGVASPGRAAAVAIVHGSPPSVAAMRAGFRQLAIRAAEPAS